MGASIMLAGGLMNTYAALAGANSQQSYYNYLADLGEQQAGMVERRGERQVSDIMDAASRQSQTVKTRGKQVNSSQRAAMAANGMGAGSASAEDVVYSSEIANENDLRQIGTNANIAATETRYDAAMEAINLRNQAAGNRVAGKYAKATGYTNAATSILNSASSVASYWYQWKDTSAGKAGDYSKFWFGV